MAHCSELSILYMVTPQPSLLYHFRRDWRQPYCRNRLLSQSHDLVSVMARKMRDFRKFSWHRKKGLYSPIKNPFTDSNFVACSSRFFGRDPCFVVEKGRRELESKQQ
jgi:hypothetical protein